MKTTVISPRYASAADFVAAVPSLFAQGKGDTLHDGRNTVRAFDTPAGRLVVKRYKRPNIVQGVAYSFFRKSKAERAYLYAAELRKRGFITPREVAFIEVKRGLLLAESYFVSECCPDPPAFGPLVAADSFNEAMADAMAAEVVAMHSKGVLHGDLNLGNFLYRRTDGGGYSFTIIDTNRSRFRDGWPTRRECIDNLKTMTHRRDVFAHIVRRYAALRRWDAEATLAEATGALDRFERRHRRKDALKHAVRHGRQA